MHSSAEKASVNLNVAMYQIAKITNEETKAKQNRIKKKQIYVVVHSELFQFVQYKLNKPINFLAISLFSFLFCFFFFY